MTFTNVSLPERFSGALLGGMVGDVIGAPVEAESAGYIRKAFRSLDDILALETVPEFLTGEWKVGHFTDDTQLTICMSEWLAAGTKSPGGPRGRSPSHSGRGRAQMANGFAVVS